MGRFPVVFLLLVSLLIFTVPSQGKCPVRATPTPNEIGEFDFIVVGGGTGGAAVAARLSEKFTVLLLESGPRLHDNKTKDGELIDTILPGNGYPLEIGDVEVNGKIVGKVDEKGKIFNSDGLEIGFMQRSIPLLSKGRTIINGDDVTDRFKIRNGKPNLAVRPDGSTFGLSIMKTPFLAGYLCMTNVSHYYQTTPQLYSQKREISYPRGNLVGGSSATNWMAFFKGHREDYDDLWRDRHGLEGWGLDDLYPYFKKYDAKENKGKKGGSHGDGDEFGGPIRSSTSADFLDYPALDEWHRAALKLGWPEMKTANDPEHQYGASKKWQQFVGEDGHRSDSSDYIKMMDDVGRVCWDTPKSECRAGQTLHIWTQKYVTKVLVDPSPSLRTRGVEFVSSRDIPSQARSYHPNFPKMADEGLKHQFPFTKWDRKSADRIPWLGAPVQKSLALDYKNLRDQYIPEEKTPLEGAVSMVTAKYEVILAAGTVATAQLLMLSGIGPADHLRSKDIPLVYPLPVGQRIQDHQEGQLHYRFPEGYKPHFDFVWEAEHAFPAAAGWISGAKKTFLGSNHVPGGVEGSSVGPNNPKKSPGWHLHHVALGVLENYDFHLGLAPESLEKPYRLPRSVEELFESEAAFYHTHLCELSHNHAYGKLELRNDDPMVLPLLDMAYGSSNEDNREMVSCLKEVRRIMSASNPKYVGTEVGPCAEAKTDQELLICVRNLVWGHHIAGSAMMSCNSDFAVTDHRARVFGVQGLRVADASLIPEMPHANPTGVILAMAEKIADMIKQDYQNPKLEKDEL